MIGGQENETPHVMRIILIIVSLERREDMAGISPSYFDLNQRAAAAALAPLPVAGAGLAEPSRQGGSVRPTGSRATGTRGESSGDFPSPQPPRVASGPAAPPLSSPSRWRPMSLWEQIVMYLGILLGVIFSSAVQQFKSGGAVSLNVTIGSLVVAAIVALVVIPLVFEKLSVRPDSPFIVRFGLFVQNGVFWHVTISSIGKTVL